ncbi:MAG: helix-turn-helix domain-containing protein [Actinobacteria bacterium]|nr:helix-turn-helix domain-containing protein [Actinomycetota bacterium]
MSGEDLQALPPTISVEEAGRILGLSRPSAYAAANAFLETGDGIPALRFGRKLRVPTARLLAMLGDDARAEAEAGGGL